MEDREELEHIPWSELRAAEPEGRRKAVYAGVAVVAAIGLGSLIARAVASPAAVEQRAIETTTSAPALAATTVAPGTPATTTVVEAGVVDDGSGESASDTEQPLYSEADLMALLEPGNELAIIARAERFVVDFFTSDLDPGGSAAVRAALTDLLELPPMPQEQGGGLSYVEWAEAYALRDHGHGLYEVDVLFVVLAAAPDSGFTRLPPRAVTIGVIADAHGGTTVADLPKPARLPIPPDIEWAMEPEPVELGEESLELVAQRIPAWGTEPRVVSAHKFITDIRVVVTVADEVGTRWPLSIIIAGPVAPG